MQRTNPPDRARDARRAGITAGALALAVAVGCSPAPAPPPETTGEDRAAEVLAARKALGEPTVALVEAVLRVADDLARVRHRVPRGAELEQALAAVPADVRRLERAARRARRAARQAERPDAAALVTAAAADAAAAAAAARTELAFLRRLSEVDRRLAAAVATWDEPGSQSERRERLAEVSASLGALRGAIRELRPAPAACTALRDNRARWAAVVQRRTERLAEHADSAGGAAYDELRDAYRRQPFGEDLRASDAAERDCWAAESEVAVAADSLSAAVDGLRDLLG